jgi:uncharacterized protein YdhG (YjbR/CyaY superfamily)
VTAPARKAAKAPVSAGAAAVDRYIATCAPQARAPLRRIRAIVRAAAPAAEEILSYGVPALRLRRILIYYAAFKAHIGMYPPVRGNAALEKALSKYMGPKGNLKFSLERPIPYQLIERLVRWRAKRSLTV